MLRRTGTRSKNCAAKLRKADSVAGAHGLCSGRAFIKLSGKLPPSAAETPVLTGERNCRRLSAETKGDRTPSMVSCPLLTPQTFLLALTHRICAAKRGLRGLGSVRRADLETLSGPEFPLRDLPRITVRGHSVQSVCTVAAKSSASIKDCALEHQTSLWAPRF